MIRTALLLLVSLVAVPTLIYFFDEPPTADQWELIQMLTMVYAIAAGTAFLISLVTDNYSQVDKLWSTIPIAYVWLVAWKVGFEPRSVLMASVATVWGIRLTVNFGMKGGYSWKFWEGEEDYRWEVLRQKPAFQNPVVWQLFNLLFISFYQMGLIMLFTFPIIKAADGDPIGIYDYLIAALYLGFVLTEGVADWQQWVFQKEKYRRKNAGEPLGEYYGVGFAHKGLWGIVRHPNYASEQAIWIVFYLFTIPATGQWVNWSIAGCVLLLILFKSSSDFSESISAGKYPLYAEYQKRVGRFLPKFGKGFNPPAAAEKETIESKEEVRS